MRRAGDFPFLLAIIYTLGFFGFLFMLMSWNVPTENADMIKQLIPVLSMIQGGIIQYFYQKAEAEKKDETIKTLANTAAAVAGAPTADVFAEKK